MLVCAYIHFYFLKTTEFPTFLKNEESKICLSRRLLYFIGSSSAFSYRQAWLKGDLLISEGPSFVFVHCFYLNYSYVIANAVFDK